MDPVEFFGLAPQEEPGRWRLPVVRGLCSGFGTFFGGAALGAAIEVLERLTGRPLVWATAQYLAFARPPDVVELEGTEVTRGHRSSQARVLARVDGREIFTVVAALGRRELDWSGSWAVRPDVPSVADSPGRDLPAHQLGTIAEQLAMRMAAARFFEELDGTPGDGRTALWVKLPGIPATASALAVVADYVPFGISQALGRRTSSNSLDNTLRMVRPLETHPTEWVLADVRVQAVADGFGHGVVHLWAEDGTLLATASQSAIVRSWADRERRAAERAPEATDQPSEAP
ncbi:MAG TPA: thioesterase family protein [Acidimicrobiia bacterium]|nr:thioesterase family protein [Acidimicrobiia bacterium]